MSVLSAALGAGYRVLIDKSVRSYSPETLMELVSIVTRVKLGSIVLSSVTRGMMITACLISMTRSVPIVIYE